MDRLVIDKITKIVISIYIALKVYEINLNIGSRVISIQLGKELSIIMVVVALLDILDSMIKRGHRGSFDKIKIKGSRLNKRG